MNRPTKEWLERCVEQHADCKEDELCEAQPLLAEVRALQAAIARVEALLPTIESSAEVLDGIRFSPELLQTCNPTAGTAAALREVARLLEVALKGEG